MAVLSTKCESDKVKSFIKARRSFKIEMFWARTLDILAIKPLTIYQVEYYNRFCTNPKLKIDVKLYTKSKTL